MLSRIGAWAAALTQGVPWTNVYGLARSLLALGTAATLAFSNTDVLFGPAVGTENPPDCAGPNAISLFCLMSPGGFPILRWVLVAALVVIAIGWRPRLTALPHWWISYSFAFTATIPDGGDHLTAVLTLLLVPVCLSDNRKWHWDAVHGDVDRRPVARLIAWSALLVIRLQVAGVYLHAAVAKLGVEEWADGTALYYWLNDPVFGAPPWLRWFIEPVTANAVGVTILTWGTIVLELALFMALVMPKRAWKPLLWAGLLFHAGIAAFMGLMSFGMAMTGALLLYLHPVERPLPLRAITRIRDRLSRLGRGRVEAASAGAVTQISP